MTTDSGLPQEVVTLLHRALPSMVHIESLLMLARLAPAPSSRWDIAAELRSSPALVAAALADLETARLVEPVPGSDGQQHRLRDPDAATAQALTSLRDVYERKPVTLIRAMYDRPAPEKPPSSVQAFADAFRVRGSDER